MDVIRIGRVRGIRSSRTQQRTELPVHVEPFPNAHIVQVLAAAQAPERARTELGLLLPQVVPQVQQGEEVAGRIGEAGVEAVGLLTALLGPLPHILDRQSRDDREHRSEHLRPLGFDEHAREARVDGQSRDAASDLGQPRAALPGVDGAELGEEVERRLHAARIRAREEGERCHVAEAEAEHLQEHGGKARAKDLGLGEFRTRGEIVFGVEADRDARRGAAGAPGALLRRGLRHWFDRQALDLAAVAVPRDAGRSGVDDVPDAGHREARLGDVGREDDAATQARCA